MRGLMNIFSLGMDQLASAIHQHGIETAVYNHAQADGVVDEIAERYRGGAITGRSFSLATRSAPTP